MYNILSTYCYYILWSNLPLSSIHHTHPPNRTLCRTRFFLVPSRTPDEALFAFFGTSSERGGWVWDPPGQRHKAIGLGREFAQLAHTCWKHLAMVEHLETMPCCWFWCAHQKDGTSQQSTVRTLQGVTALDEWYYATIPVSKL